ncbi:RNA-binding protein Cwf29 [Neocucurbitaria cava]|uniref:RNA-binding protein Cwf29 n=1 Tax=Neocucurbitaria cava TaxID=798079 RepID=A0A9W9CQA9_9PLEO|nr:RNA-binding protein Cwf29 [Neocucurbitaria cava]
MNSIRAIQQLNKRELEAGINPGGSWHTDYRDTAFIYIGGLPFELSEGDIITVFSQYGEPVWIKLARDRETGKSRGFAWIKYEDQRSCDLAVDNLGGATIMDRVLRVDHARYKPKDDEDMRDNTMGELELDHGNESDGARRKRRKTESESDSDDRPMLPEEIELERLMDKLDEDDPMRDSMIKRQQEKVDDALKKLKKSRRMARKTAFEIVIDIIGGSSIQRTRTAKSDIHGIEHVVAEVAKIAQTVIETEVGNDVMCTKITTSATRLNATDTVNARAAAPAQSTRKTNAHVLHVRLYRTVLAPLAVIVIPLILLDLSVDIVVASPKTENGVDCEVDRPGIANIMS